MRKILFPTFNRVHEARQKLLLEELSKDFQVCITTYGEKDMDMAKISVDIAGKFQNALDKIKPDILLARGDRAEILPAVMLAFYNGVKIVHIEGGAVTGDGIFDSKVRHAITQLSDLHLVTDEQARRNVISMGISPDKVFNVGSFDVSYAQNVVKGFKSPQGDTQSSEVKDYVLVLHHFIPGEDSELVLEAVRQATNLKIIGTRGNKDYQKSIFKEEYTPEKFISLLKYAKCFVSNSSASCKEASILGCPVVLCGRRQDGRLAGHNVIRVPHNLDEIRKATKYQIEHGSYPPDYVYYKPNSEQLACEIIKNFV